MTNVLVINCGSSSIKYQLVQVESKKAIAKGIVERIGEGTSEQALGVITHEFEGQKHSISLFISDHEQGLRKVIELFNHHGPNLEKTPIDAVGHRVVQGGSTISKAVIVDAQIEELISELSPLAPLHNVPNLLGIKVAKQLFKCPHVAVFDTAFFADLPAQSATYAIDTAVATKYKIRRYGAHGTSHKFVSENVAEFVSTNFADFESTDATVKEAENHKKSLKSAQNLKQIVLHLGNGASITAIDGGKPVDTSMGLTPLEGLVMGTRSGDVDPALPFYLAKNANMSVDDIDKLLNKASGMKGLCGENDMRIVWENIEKGDNQSILAMNVYIHRLVKYIGAYIGALNGVDVITFTAGIGENDSLLREKVCERLSWFGIELDKDKNAERSSSPRIISSENSRIAVLVYPTNEELSIAEQAMALL